MGKEWLHWGLGGSGRKGRMEEKEETSISCCMTAVLHLFDLHPLNQNNNSPSDFRSSQLGEEAAIASKGVEEPRNSQELGVPGLDNTALSTAIKDFPIGIQIRTKIASSPRVSISGSKSSLNDICSSESPGTKTPTVVARLMGLDLLPAECNSPSAFRRQMESHSPKSYLRKDTSFLHGKSCYDNDIRSGARSLPETPRISSARRPDIELHRLSLQINKDSVDVNEEMDRAIARRERSFRLLQVQDENIAPGHSAKQFAEQVKDRASRRFGRNITNTNIISTRHTRRDENLVLLKTRSRNSTSSSRFGGESVALSYSPSPPYSDKLIANSGTRSSSISTFSDNHLSRRIINPSLPRNQITIPFQERQKQQQHKGAKIRTSTGKCSSSGVKKLPRQASSGKSVRNKKEETFVRSTARNKANLTGKKSKKDSSPRLTKLPPKQVSDALSPKRSTQLSRNPNRPYKPQTNGSATARHGGSAADYKDYIQTILERVGTVKYVSGLDLNRWRSRSHLIDPSIFYYLEFFFSSSVGTDLSRRCNRKLLFELVDELLGEILRPRFNLVPGVSSLAPNDKFPLVEGLCKKIDGFLATSCAAVDVIDSLIAKDMRKSVFEEELESMVLEIEGGIVEWLVTETAGMVVRRRGGGTDRERQM